jgi:hypothetical protein
VETDVPQKLDKLVLFLALVFVGEPSPALRQSPMLFQKTTETLKSAEGFEEKMISML